MPQVSSGLRPPTPALEEDPVPCPPKAGTKLGFPRLPPLTRNMSPALPHSPPCGCRHLCPAHPGTSRGRRRAPSAPAHLCWPGGPGQSHAVGAGARGHHADEALTLLITWRSWRGHGFGKKSGGKSRWGQAPCRVGAGKMRNMQESTSDFATEHEWTLLIM